MSRLVWKILACSLLLPLLALVFLPFTERGSRVALDGVARLLPLEIDYDGGTLAGELSLRRLAWNSDGVRLELLDVGLELAPGCLWRSTICFRQLFAGELDIILLPAPAPAPAPGPDREPAGQQTRAELFEFPVPLVASGLRIDALRVAWEGGEWRQGNLQGSVRVTGATVRVEHAHVAGAFLSQTGGDDSPGTPQLPVIHLPLDLVVDELLLGPTVWKLAGESGELDSLRLRGNWRRTGLRLDELRVEAARLGQWDVSGDVDFAGEWPLTVAVEGVLPQLPGWPDFLERGLAVEASGDLANLVLEAEMDGRVALAARGSMNTLSRELPFQLDVEADWEEVLALSELVEMPESLAELAFAAPVRVYGNGTLDRQELQLQGVLDGPGYESVTLDLAASHESGRVVVKELVLRDKAGANTLRGEAEIDYAQEILWSALLESDGLDLIPPGGYPAGRIEGRLRLLGRLDGDDWEISLADVELDGTVNDMPARLWGRAGIDSQLRLLPGELRGDINGTRLLLQASAGSTGHGRLHVELDDLGRWLPGSSGEFDLRADIEPGLEHFGISGSAGGVTWQDLRIGSAELQGSYGQGGAKQLAAEVTLADLAVAAVELDALRLVARGTPSAHDLTLYSEGDVEGVLALAGGVGEGGQWSGQLTPATLRTPVGDWTLGEPVAMDFSAAGDRLRLAAHCWQLQDATLCPGEALLGPEGAASVALQGDLASLGDLLPQHLRIEGGVSAQLTASWSAGQGVTLDGAAQGSDLLFTRDHGEGQVGSIRVQKISAFIKNDPQGLSLSAQLDTQGNRIVELAVGLPADRAGPLSGELAIRGLQLDTVAPLVPDLAVLRGELEGNLRLAGTAGNPLVSGEMRLTGGHFALLGNPTELQQMEVQLAAHREGALIRGSGLLGGGRVSLGGELSTQPDWRLQLAIEGENQEILLPPFTQVLVSEKLQLVATPGLLNLSGDIVVHEGSLEQQRLPEGSVTLSGDVLQVDIHGNVISEPAPFDTGVTVNLLIEDKFAIRGDIVNATLGGDLHLRQERGRPLQVFGSLNVIGGDIRAYQQQLRIKRGSLGFVGRPENPELDVRAQREIPADRVVVGLQLRGTLEQPVLEVFSEPAMSPSETMSYLLRGRRQDSGAEADGIAMALSMGSGLVNRSALVTELNRIPGINNVAFGAEGRTEQDTAATVGGFIGERLYLSYGMGIYEPINVLTARLYLQSRLWFEVVSRLENSVDLYYAFDIN